MSKKMVRNMKLAFTDIYFRHNSTYVIQKWLEFKKVVHNKSFLFLDIILYFLILINEHLAVPFVKLVKNGSYVGYLC